MATIKYKGANGNRPKQAFTTSCELFTPTWSSVQGVARKTYTSQGQMNCLWKSYGGTETESNGQIVVQDTANVQTWFRSDITASSRVSVNGKMYEIIGEPENIEMRNQFLKFKVKRVSGNA